MQVSSPKKCSAVCLIACIHLRESNSTFFSAGRLAKFDETKRDLLVFYVNTYYDGCKEIFMLVSCGQSSQMGHPAAPSIYTISLFHCMAVLLNCGPDSLGLGAGWEKQRAKRLFQDHGSLCLIWAREPWKTT